MKAQSRSQIFTNTLFEANTASPLRLTESRGAALWLSGTRPEGGGVVDPTIIDDEAVSDDEELNAFFGGTLVIRGCRFHDNYGEVLFTILAASTQRESAWRPRPNV